MIDHILRLVRIKVSVLVLAPLLAGVPVLLFLVWSWGNQAYERLLTFKVSSDMITANGYFERARVGVGHDVSALASSNRLA